MKKQMKIVWHRISESDIVNYINKTSVLRKYICTAWIKNYINDTYQYLIYLSSTKNESTFNKDKSNLKCFKKIKSI